MKFLGDSGTSGLRHAPALGEHTREVLRDVIGLAPAEIDGLISRGLALQSPDHKAASA